MKIQGFFTGLAGMLLLACTAVSGNNLEPSLEGRIEECRIALKDLENLKKSDQNLGESEIFNSLLSNAALLLKEIGGNHNKSELLFLLGQCQGIIDSLELVMHKKRYKGDRSHYGSAKSAHTNNPKKNQAVARPNAVKLEPLEPIELDEELNKSTHSKAQVVVVDSRQLRQKQAGTHDDMPLHEER